MFVFDRDPKAKKSASKGLIWFHLGSWACFGCSIFFSFVFQHSCWIQSREFGTFNVAPGKSTFSLLTYVSNGPGLLWRCNLFTAITNAYSNGNNLQYSTCWKWEPYSTRWLSTLVIKWAFISTQESKPKEEEGWAIPMFIDTLDRAIIGHHVPIPHSSDPQFLLVPFLLLSKGWSPLRLWFVAGPFFCFLFISSPLLFSSLAQFLLLKNQKKTTWRKTHTFLEFLSGLL